LKGENEEYNTEDKGIGTKPPSEYNGSKERSGYEQYSENQ
jgi:hypothetical protein